MMLQKREECMSTAKMNLVILKMIKVSRSQLDVCVNLQILFNFSHYLENCTMNSEANIRSGFKSSEIALIRREKVLKKLPHAGLNISETATYMYKVVPKNVYNSYAIKITIVQSKLMY